MKKESKEVNSQHNKILKTKDDIIENLKKFKSEKNAQERDLKQKQKKINKKLKSLEERESKFMKDVQNSNILNNNDDPEHGTNSCSPSSDVFHMREVPNLTIITTAITSCPSTVTHWLCPVKLAAQSDFLSFISHRVSANQSDLSSSDSFSSTSSAT